MAAVRHLGFIACMRGTSRDVFLVVFPLYKMFRIGLVVLIISKFT